MNILKEHSDKSTNRLYNQNLNAGYYFVASLRKCQ